MSRRNRSHGRIASVETMVRGGTVDVDAAAGATSITVADAGDFDEDGGTLAIGMVLSGGEWDYSSAQLIGYVADDETGILTLSTALAAAAEAGDPVHLWDPLYEEAVEFQEALVVLDGDRDNPEEIVAEVAEGVAALPEGDRGRAGESCTLKRVSEDEWEVVAVGGRSRKSAGVKFFQDQLVVTDLGNQSIALTHTPIENSEHLYWNGLYQPGSEWSRNGRVVSVPDPAGHVRVDDELVVEYAYLHGLAATAGVEQNVTITMVSNSHFDVLRLVFVLPDGSRYEVPDVNTPGATAEQEFGSFVVDDMNLEFTNVTEGTTVNYPSPAYIRRSEISGTDATRGDYTGYRYEFEDRGPAGDDDFNDIVMDVRAY